MSRRTALVVLSGGADSTVSLFWARQNYEMIHALTFNYGQRHVREIEAAQKVAGMAHVVSHEIIELGPILKGTSPLTDLTAEVGHYDSVSNLPGGIEPTFVPGRNILFLALASNRAAVVGANAIVLGLCAMDFGGYPDCRDGFVKAMNYAINLGLFGPDETPNRIIIETPLMFLTKAQSVELAVKIPGAMEALAFSLTSYDGDYPPNPFNHASLLRAKGFREAGVPDPLVVRAISESLLPADYPPDGLVEGTKYNSQEEWATLGGLKEVVSVPEVAEEEKPKKAKKNKPEEAVETDTMGS